MTAFQQTLYELERRHQSIRQQYEDEIARLRRELDGFPEGVPPPILGQIRPSSGSAFGSLIGQPQPPPGGAYPSDQEAASAPPPMQPTGFIDFDARKNSEEGRTISDDYQTYINPVNVSTRSPPLRVEPVNTIKVQSVVCCVKFSPDGRYLGVGCSKSTEIYDVQTMQRVCVLTDDTTRKDYYIRSVVFSPDGRFIASGAEDHLVRVGDIAKQSIKLRLPGHQLDIYSLDWARDGTFIASASGDRTVKIWDPETGACRMTLSCDEDPTRSIGTDQSKDTGVTSVAIRPSDCRCIAAGAIDDTIRLWDTRTGQLLERFVGHVNSVYAVAFSPTGMSLVSGSLDKSLRVWDLSPETLQTLSEHPNSNGASAGGNGEVARRRPLLNTRPRHLFRGHRDFILSVAFPGKVSSLGTVDRSGKPISGLPPSATDIDWIVSASKDRHVTLWDGSLQGVSPDSVPVALLSGHRNSVISVAVSSVGGLMATGSGDMKTRIWRVYRDTGANGAAAGADGKQLSPSGATVAASAGPSAAPRPAESSPTLVAASAAAASKPPQPTTGSPTRAIKGEAQSSATPAAKPVVAESPAASGAAKSAGPSDARSPAENEDLPPLDDAPGGASPAKPTDATTTAGNNGTAASAPASAPASGGATAAPAAGGAAAAGAASDAQGENGRADGKEDDPMEGQE
nr:general transcription repressor [Polyrhizophydium stewartii]